MQHVKFTYQKAGRRTPFVFKSVELLRTYPYFFKDYMVFKDKGLMRTLSNYSFTDKVDRAMQIDEEEIIV
jgi:hypothetical protein